MNLGIQSLTRRLQVHRKNLDYLQEQAAQYGVIAVPLDLRNRIDAEQQAIIQIEEEISKYLPKQAVSVNTISDDVPGIQISSPRFILIVMFAIIITSGAVFLFFTRPKLPETPSNALTPDTALASPTVAITQVPLTFASTETPLPTATVTASTPTQQSDLADLSRIGQSFQQPTEPIDEVNVSQITQMTSWGHGVAYDIAWTSDGTEVAVSTSRGIYFYDAFTGNQQRSFKTDQAVTAIAISKDLLALGFWDGTVQVKNLNTGGSMIYASKKHKNIVGKLVFSPDGKWLGSIGGNVLLWSTGDFSPTTTISTTGYVSGLAFSPDSSQVAVSTLDKGVQLLSVKGAMVWNRPDLGGNYSVAFLPDGQTIAVTGYEQISLLLTNTGVDKSPPLIDHYKNRKWIGSLTTANQLLISGGYDGSLQFWNPSKEQWLDSINTSGNIAHLMSNPAGTRLASLSRDGSLRIWEVQTRQEVWHDDQFLGGISSIAMEPNTATLIVAQQEGLLQRRRISDGTLVNTFGDFDYQYSQIIFSVAASPDGKRVASTTGFDDGKTYLWDASDASWRATLPSTSPQNQRIPPVRMVTFSPDSSLVVSASENSMVRIWSASDGTLIQSLTESKDITWRAIFSPSGDLLATCSGDTNIRIYKRSKDGKYTFLKELSGHSGAVRGLAFSPDGSLLASSSYFPDGSVRLWDPKKGTFLRTLIGQATFWNDLHFTADAKVLVGAEAEGEHRLKFVRVADGRVLADIPTNHTSFIDNITFSADYKLLFIPSWDGIIQVWGIPPKNGGKTTP